MKVLFTWIGNNLFNLIDVAGLTVSTVTMIIAMNFKKRVTKRAEKLDFLSERDVFINQLEGDILSYMNDNQYIPVQLERTRLLLDVFRSKYTFINRTTKRSINTTYKLIIKNCYPESIKSIQKHRIDLCESLNRVVANIKKEEVLM